jgi:hypothetical protein
VAAAASPCACRCRDARAHPRPDSQRACSARTGTARDGHGRSGHRQSACCGRARTEGTAEAPNPADYAPAQEPAADNPLGGHVRRGTAAGVPLYQDAAAVPGTQIPPLRLDLHVFSARVQDRFAMINMHKVHEGDTLPEGVHVDSITPEGAVLSYNGSRFLLPRE